MAYKFLLSFVVLMISTCDENKPVGRGCYDNIDGVLIRKLVIIKDNGCK